MLFRMTLSLCEDRIARTPDGLDHRFSNAQADFRRSEVFLACLFLATRRSFPCRIRKPLFASRPAFPLLTFYGVALGARPGRSRYWLSTTSTATNTGVGWGGLSVLGRGCVGSDAVSSCKSTTGPAGEARGMRSLVLSPKCTVCSPLPLFLGRRERGTWRRQ